MWTFFVQGLQHHLSTSFSFVKKYLYLFMSMFTWFNQPDYISDSWHWQETAAATSAQQPPAHMPSIRPTYLLSSIITDMLSGLKCSHIQKRWLGSRDFWSCLSCWALKKGHSHTENYEKIPSQTSRDIHTPTTVLGGDDWCIFWKQVY